MESIMWRLIFPFFKNFVSYFQILYRDSDVNSPKDKRIPGCDTLCPLEHYNSFVSTRIVTSREKFNSICQNNEIVLEQKSSH